MGRSLRAALVAAFLATAYAAQAASPANGSDVVATTASSKNVMDTVVGASAVVSEASVSQDNGSAANDVATTLASSFGPITTKTVAAITYLGIYGDHTQVQELKQFQIGDMTWLTVKQTRDNEAVLVFSGMGFSESTFAQGDAPIPFAQAFLPNATLPLSIVDTFSAVADGTAGIDGELYQFLTSTFDDSEPLLHIITVGDGPNGHLAHYAGLWAALAFPAANVDVFSFGISFSGSAASAWLFNRLVQLYYIYPYGSGTVGNAMNSELDDVKALFSAVWVTNTASVLAQATTLSNALPFYLSSLNYGNDGSYRQLRLGNLAPSQNVETAFLQPPGFDAVERSVLTGTLTSSQSVTVESGKVPSNAGQVPASQVASALDGSSATANYSQLCTPLLCRARELLSASCSAFGDEQNATAYFSGSSVAFLSSGSGAAAAVSWVESTRTAVLVWQGTNETQDWFDNLNLTSRSLPDMGIAVDPLANVSVHSGFYDQFQSLAINPRSQRNNVTAQILALSGGVAPNRILVSGYSLGSALAPLSAVWLSTVWPAASVSVSGIGVPGVGNSGWSTLFRQTVGTAIQFSYESDPVADVLGVIDGYETFREDMWIPASGLAIAAQRPPFYKLDLLAEIDAATNVNDHMCDSAYIPSLDATAAITVPGYVANSAS